MAAVTPPATNSRNIAATATALTAASTIVSVGVQIKLSPSATAPVYVGLSNAVSTSTGFPIYPGESQQFDVKFIPGWAPGISSAPDLAGLYLISGTGTQTVYYWYV